MFWTVWGCSDGLGLSWAAWAAWYCVILFWNRSVAAVGYGLALSNWSSAFRFQLLRFQDPPTHSKAKALNQEPRFQTQIQDSRYPGIPVSRYTSMSQKALACRSKGRRIEVLKEFCENPPGSLPMVTFFYCICYGCKDPGNLCIISKKCSNNLINTFSNTSDKAKTDITKTESKNDKDTVNGQHSFQTENQINSTQTNKTNTNNKTKVTNVTKTNELFTVAWWFDC